MNGLFRVCELETKGYQSISEVLYSYQHSDIPFHPATQTLTYFKAIALVPVQSCALFTHTALSGYALDGMFIAMIPI